MTTTVNATDPQNSPSHSGLHNTLNTHSHGGTTGDGDAAVSHANLSNVTTDQHHAKSHVHTGDGSGTVAHSSLSSVTADQHHTQSHDHSASGDGQSLAPAAKFALTGDISPTALASDTNDWAPTNLSTAAVIRASASSAVNLTGLTGGSDGRIIVMHNIGANNITLKDESASSTAANRFALTGDITMATDAVTVLQYDSTSSRWRAVSGGGGGAGTTVATDVIWDAKGDLAAGTGADTASKLTVGSNRKILTADSSASTGLSWQDHAGVTTVNGFTLSGTTTETATMSYTIPANMLTTESVFRFKLTGTTKSNTGAETLTIAWAVGSFTQLINSTVTINNTANKGCMFEGHIGFSSIGATATPVGSLWMLGNTDAASALHYQMKNSATGSTFDSTASATLSVTLTWSSSSVNNSFSNGFGVIELLRI